jgi:uridine phosphorylase
MAQDATIHTQLKPGDVARYVLLPGDPGRVERIADMWDEAQKIASFREYVTYTGTVDGVRISATSTGIGCPSAAIAVEELCRVGADTFIRVGTSGCMGEHVSPGDLIITVGAIRGDGTSKTYVRPEYPAVAHYQLVCALIQAATTTDRTFHVGITYTVDGFYSGNKLISKEGLQSMSFNNFDQSYASPLMMDAKRAGALNQEMEAGTILTLANLFGVRAGAVCAASDRVPWDSPSGIDFLLSEEYSIRTGIEAVKILAGWDERQKKTGSTYWHPDM